MLTSQEIGPNLVSFHMIIEVTQIRMSFSGVENPKNPGIHPSYETKCLFQHIGGNPGTIASTLQWTNIQCITDSQCKRVWATSTITARQQCADTNGVTSCMGDSGGPLTIKQGGKDVLLGNVSWGHSKCSTSGYPAVYSRNAVPAIHSWIKTNAGI